MGSSAGSRTRNWTAILYPESLPPDWQSRLASGLVPCCISPLHSLDPENINPEEQRKDHFHLGLFFDSVKSSIQVFDYLLNTLGTGFTSPQFMISSKACIRYFIHLDQPEKQQFPSRWDSLLCLNGFRIDDFLVPTSSEKSKFLEEMSRFIQDNNICEFSDFFYYARDHHFDTWYYLLVNGCSNLICMIINSQRNKWKKKEGNK